MNGHNAGDQKGSKTTIIQALRAQGPASRIDLARLTGLSRATVSLGVAGLVEARIVHETTKSEAARGRPATLLELTPGSTVVVGAAFGVRRWTIGAFDLLGNTVSEHSIAVTDTDPQSVVSVLADALPPIIAALPTKPLPVVGLGLPGLVDTEQGIISSASDLGWHNVAIGEMMSRALGLPVIVLNRHRARGLAECRYGAARTYRQVIYIGVNTGIAAGIFQDGKLVTGAAGGAGEIGHLTIDPNGPLCPCGNHGCLQLVAASGALEIEMRRLLRTGRSSSIVQGPDFDLRLIRAEDICTAADAGDPVSREVVGKAAEYLGISMANLVNILNPEIIVLGGLVPTFCRYYVEQATLTMRRRAMTPLSAHLEVRQAAFTQIGGALGAATFALDQTLTYSLFH